MVAPPNLFVYYRIKGGKQRKSKGIFSVFCITFLIVCSKKISIYKYEYKRLQTHYENINALKVTQIKWHIKGCYGRNNST